MYGCTPEAIFKGAFLVNTETGQRRTTARTKEDVFSRNRERARTTNRDAAVRAQNPVLWLLIFGSSTLELTVWLMMMGRFRSNEQQFLLWRVDTMRKFFISGPKNPSVDRWGHGTFGCWWRGPVDGYLDFVGMKLVLNWWPWGLSPQRGFELVFGPRCSLAHPGNGTAKTGGH